MPTTLDTPTWVNLALQIPLALVIVFLVIRFLDHLRHTHEATLKFMTEQASVNREFLTTQREHMNSSIGRLAEEIKSNRMDTIKEIATLTANVDRSIDRLMDLDSRITLRERKQ